LNLSGSQIKSLKVDFTNFCQSTWVLC